MASLPATRPNLDVIADGLPAITPQQLKERTPEELARLFHIAAGAASQFRRKSVEACIICGHILLAAQAHPSVKRGWLKWLAAWSAQFGNVPTPNLIRGSRQ